MSKSSKQLFCLIMSIISFVIVSFIIDSSPVNFKNGYSYFKFSDHWSHLESKKENYEFYGILDYSYNDEYIIAVKVKGGLVDCEGYLSMYYENKLQYIIINIKNAQTIITEDENKFIHKKNLLDINLEFSFDRDKLEKKLLSYISPNSYSKCTKVSSYIINLY